jgi:hypothetical protein
MAGVAVLKHAGLVLNQTPHCNPTDRAFCPRIFHHGCHGAQFFGSAS